MTDSELEELIASTVIDANTTRRLDEEFWKAEGRKVQIMQTLADALRRLDIVSKSGSVVVSSTSEVRRKRSLKEVTLEPERWTVFKLERGKAPLRLSLDDGTEVTVTEGKGWADRFTEPRKALVWQYMDEPEPEEWILTQTVPVEPLVAQKGQG